MWERRRVWRGSLTNYISTKVGSTTKNGEKYGQNGMGGRGRRAGWRKEKDEMGGGSR
jgi:hypothetical protein